MVPTLAVEKLDWGSVDFEHLVEDLQLNVAFLVSIILLFQQILSKIVIIWYKSWFFVKIRVSI